MSPNIVLGIELNYENPIKNYCNFASLIVNINILFSNMVY